MTQAPCGRSPQRDPTSAATLHFLARHSDFCPEPRGGGRWAPTCGRGLWAPRGPLPSQAGLIPGHCHQHDCGPCSAPAPRQGWGWFLIPSSPPPWASTSQLTGPGPRQSGKSGGVTKTKPLCQEPLLCPKASAETGWALESPKRVTIGSSLQGRQLSEESKVGRKLPWRPRDVRPRVLYRRDVSGGTRDTSGRWPWGSGEGGRAKGYFKECFVRFLGLKKKLHRRREVGEV